jgi:hypothetical protein
MKSELRAKQQQKSFKAFREIADPRGLTGKFFFSSSVEFEAEARKTTFLNTENAFAFISADRH